MLGLKKFLKDTQGGFAIWFAVSAMALTIAVGAAYDLNQAQSAQSYLQDLNDSAALAAAHDKNAKTSKKRKEARAFIKSGFETKYKLRVIKVKLKENDDVVRVTTTAELQTMMMGIVGKEGMEIKVVSEVNQTASGGPVEISFILDTTSSMNNFGGQWNQVVNALEDLMTELETNAGNSGQFKASLVPFSDRVNLGDKKFDWIDMSYLADPAAAAAYRGCTEPRGQLIGGNPHALTARKPKKLPFIPSTVGTYGYVSTCPSVGIAYPTDNISKVKSELKNITPSGTGRFDIGLAWGYRMLSNKWRKPIGGGGWPKKKTVTKVAVLLTDGYSYAYEKEVGPPADPQPWGWNHGTPEGFDNLIEICDRMKADNIQIHVIGAKTQAQALPYLKACATSVDHYYSVSTSYDLIDAIGEIGIKTSALRLSH